LFEKDQIVWKEREGERKIDGTGTGRESREVDNDTLD
jgi:hypothetical protein